MEIRRHPFNAFKFIAPLLLGMMSLGVPQRSPAAPPSGYYEVWNDEFDGSSLDTSKWTVFTGTHRDAVNTASAVSVGSSTLTLTTYTSSGTHYTGYIGTSGKFYAKFGYFESYIKWADSAGMWSAFWLQSDLMGDWPFPTQYVDDTLEAGAEIDICEHRSQNSSGTSIASEGVSNLHWNGYDTNATSTGSSLYGSSLNSGYHTYGLLWDSSTYKFYCDGSQVYSTTTANSEHSEWILLTSEVLDGGWSGSIPSGGYGSLSGSSTKMQTAYVRYYAPGTMSFWTGSTSAYWTNSANWVSSHSPGSGYDVVVCTLSTGNYTTHLGGDYTVNSLSSFNTSYITIKDNTLTINDHIDLNSAWNNLQINSDVVLGGANTWRVGSGYTLYVNGNVSGGHSLTINGFGTVSLAGDNSYTLGTTVAKGTLRISSDTALGTTNVGTTVSSSGQLQIYSDLTCDQPLNLNGTAPALRVSANADAVWTGPITLGNASTIKVDGGTTLDIQGGISGGHSLYLDSSSGGVGTISSAITTGAFPVTKSGAGTWILSGTNTFTGALNVDSGSTSANDGVLCVASASAVGSASGIQIRNNTGNAAAATFQLDGSLGGFAVPQGISLAGRNNMVPAIENLAGTNTLSGDITISSGGADYIVQSDADTLILGGHLSSSTSSARTFIFQGAGNIAMSGIITNGASSAFSIIKTGAGTMTLLNANTYNGTTEIDGGALVLASGGSISNSALINVTNGAIFDVSALGGWGLNAGQTLGGSGVVTGSVTAVAGSFLTPGSTPTPLVFTNSLALNGATLSFGLSKDPAGTNDLIVVAGNLNLAGTNTIAITPVSGSLPTGRYRLIRYAGARTGGMANFTTLILGVPPNVLMTVDDSVTNEIDLVVTSFAGSLTWVGNGGFNRWDAAVSTNWLNGSTSTVFTTGDSVQFDDSSTNPVVNLIGTLYPGLVTVSNNNNNYVFTNSGWLAGAAGLWKMGTGSLIVLNTNVNTGTIEIDAGLVQVGNGTNSGSLGSGGVIDNGILSYNTPDTQTVASVISGTGSLLKPGSGALVFNGVNSFSGGATLGGGTVYANNSFAFGSGPLTLNGAVKRVIFTNGVVATNAITLTPGTGSGGVGQGYLTGPASGTATLSGPIIQNASVVSGGTFDGGNTSGGLVISGSITSSVPVIQRANRVTYSGGGAFNFLQSFSAVVLGATNGLPTNAVLELGTSGYTASLDLAGMSQTLNGLQNGTGAATVGNSSTNSDAQLILCGVSSNTTYGGVIADKLGGGSQKVWLTVAGGTFTLTGANTFTGGTRVTGGTLVLSNKLALANSTLDLEPGDAGTVSFATLTTAIVGGITGSANLALTNKSGAGVTLVVGNGNTNPFTYAGSFTGNGSVSKTNSNTCILTGTNTFTGTLYVDGARPSSGNDGVLRLAAPCVLAGPTNIAIQNMNSSTSTLQLDGMAGGLVVTQNVLLNGRNSLVPAIENLAGTNTLTGNLSISSGGTNYWLQSDAGQMVLGGFLGLQSLTSARVLTFQGSGDFLVAGVITNGSSYANSVVQNGTGTLILGGNNPYSGPTTVNNGLLLANGSIGTNAVTVSGGALGGTGLIRGPVTILSGGTLSPGALLGVTSTLTISNSLNLNGTAFLALNPAAGTNDQVRGLAGVTYGGTLSLTNLSGGWSTNSAFKLFAATGYTGAFIAISPAQPAPGFAWNTNTLASDGTLRVVQTVSQTAFNLVPQVAGNTLTLSWPADHTGWRLQAQTNDINSGLTGNWVDLSGADATNQVVIPIDPNNGTVFYRMVFP